MLDRDWIDDWELYAEPNPSRLGAACLMIYAGLLLSLGAILAVGPAAAHAPESMAVQDRSIELSAMQGIEFDPRVFARSVGLDIEEP